jgi:hypothetical protein
MPTPVDLVTDLPADFEVFGQAVDSSLADLKGGTSGQVLSKNSNTDMDFVWVTSDDANAIQNTIVDAKGDLIAATAADTPARLAVGANNTFLRANSSAATGLEYAGAYTSFTPTWFNLTVGNAQQSARYLRIGNFVHVEQTIIFGSTTSVAGSIFCDFPITANTAANEKHVGLVTMLDAGTQIFTGIAAQNSGSNFRIEVNVSNATYTYANSATATVPFTWTTNDRIIVNYMYEAA